MKVRIAAAALLAASFVAAGSIPAKSASGASTAYEIDVVHSYVLFRVKHMGVGYAYGRFNDFSGTVTLDDDATKSSVVVKVNPASVDTGNAKRDEHLKTPDFFNCAQFPDLKFESTAVKKVDDHHMDVTGNLTMHGVTKPVTVPCELNGPMKDFQGKQRIGVEGSVVIQRGAWGMAKSLGDGGDDVRFTISVEATK